VTPQFEFIKADGTPIKPWFPPVGVYARLMTARISDPFDGKRLPTTFIERVTFYPQTGRVRINP
jgi:hypothetical protein